jgi:hypothetical protein
MLASQFGIPIGKNGGDKFRIPWHSTVQHILDGEICQCYCELLLVSPEMLLDCLDNPVFIVRCLSKPFGDLFPCRRPVQKKVNLDQFGLWRVFTKLLGCDTWTSGVFGSRAASYLTVPHCRQTNEAVLTSWRVVHWHPGFVQYLFSNGWLWCFIWGVPF